MIKQEIDDTILACQDCDISLLEVNDRSQFTERGYGKLLGKEGNESNDIMVVGLNPSYKRYKGLHYPFDADLGAGNENAGAIFVVMLQALGVYDRCYVTNIVKCSTNSNKVDLRTMHMCLDHFVKEVDYCDPKLILACGNQVYEFLSKYYDNRILTKIYHPNYCFSYHRMTNEEYLFHVKEVLDGYEIL